MGRSIIVGDVHGCRGELEALLKKVRFCAPDRLYLLGDLVARGPDSQGVVELARALGAVSVRGNHDDKIASWKAATDAGQPPPSMSAMHLRVARSLRAEDHVYLARMPLWHDLPDHGARLVHAGVQPGIPIERQSRRTLLTVRSLDEAGEPQEKAGTIAWGARYLDPVHVVFGHHAQPMPQLHPMATGIDTGCVYGGSLTAMVLEAGQQVPPLPLRSSVLVSVDAKRRWFTGR